MRTLFQTIQVSKSVKIIPFGDPQFGSENTDEKAFRDFVKEHEKEKDTYFLEMGDLWDCILPGDKRFNPETPYKTFDEIYYRVRDILYPIKDRVLLWLRGNHDEELVKRGIGDPVARLCKDFYGDNWQSRYGKYCSFLSLTAQKPTKSCTLVFFLHHGYFAGRKSGAAINNMEDTPASFSADIYIWGHSHKTIVSKKPVLNPHGAKVLGFLNSGTFMKCYNWDTVGYGERAQYPPTTIGAPEMVWYPWEEHRINGGKLRGKFFLTI